MLRQIPEVRQGAAIRRIRDPCREGNPFKVIILGNGWISDLLISTLLQRLAIRGLGEKKELEGNFGTFLVYASQVYA